VNCVHPIDFVESILAADTRIKEVQLSVYRYHPQSLFDDRNPTYHVPTAKLREAYKRFVEGLSNQEDIAFHSMVKMDDGVERHFGLLDFQAGTTESAVVEQASELLIREYRPHRAALVNSGRSYHLYLGALFSQAEWVAFMGRVLLLNLRDQPPTVDPRWIGHRLMAGYGALRWSANVRKPLPEVVRQWDSPEASSAEAGP
jgi:hypothetical protein